MHQSIIGAISGSPICQIPLICHCHALLRHLPNRVGDKERVHRSGHPLPIVLILHRNDVVFGDANRNLATGGVGCEGIFDIVDDGIPGALRLG